MAKQLTSKAPAIPEDENPVDPVPASVEDQLLAALASPELATRVVEAASQTARGKRLLGIPAGAGAPTGDWVDRDYDNDRAIAVTGGVEVKHPPGFQALPPSYIARYEAAEGGTTDHIETAYGDEGRPVGPAAKMDAQGRPVLTSAHKHWRDVKSSGKRLNSDVRSDMAAGAFSADNPSFSSDSVGFAPLTER